MSEQFFLNPEKLYNFNSIWTQINFAKKLPKLTYYGIMFVYGSKNGYFIYLFKIVYRADMLQ